METARPCLEEAMLYNDGLFEYDNSNSYFMTAAWQNFCQGKFLKAVANPAMLYYY